MGVELTGATSESSLLEGGMWDLSFEDVLLVLLAFACLLTHFLARALVRLQYSRLPSIDELTGFTHPW